MRRREELNTYVRWTKITAITLDDLQNYWHRRNRLAIVKFSEDNFLVFLVSDDEKPEIPGHPASSIERFKTHEKAIKAIKNCYKRLNYIPENAEYGFWTS